jgi:hypothetical protein
MLFTWANTPRPLVFLGPPQTVQTRHPVLCAHTRLTDEVEPWKILRTLEMVREMGAPTIVEYFPWAYYEGQPGRFAWGHADMVVDFARNQGLTVVARLGGLVPIGRAGSRTARSVDTYLDADHFADFATTSTHCRALQGRVRHPSSLERT